jgi:hypothetical protein
MTAQIHKLQIRKSQKRFDPQIANLQSATLVEGKKI